MDDVEPVWSRLMLSAGYRAAIVCARLAAAGGVVSVIAVVVAGTAVSGRVVLSLMAVTAAFTVISVVIGWSVMGLAVRQVLRSVRAQGRAHFSVEWLPLLSGLYFRQLISSRWTRNLDISPEPNDTSR